MEILNLSVTCMPNYKVGSVSTTKIEFDLIERITGKKIINESDSFYIDGVSTIDYIRPHRLIFIEKISAKEKEILKKAKYPKTLFIINEDLNEIPLFAKIITSNPRAIYSFIVAHLFDYYTKYWNGFIALNLAKKKYPDVTIMPGVNVHESANIGAGSTIFPGVQIGPRCAIGKNVIIKSNSVIGEPGFGIFKNQNGYNNHLPHVGGVIIGDNVEIGALNTVCSGTIHPTVVEDYVKTDDHVHIAHNCHIHTGVQIAAHAEISGSVIVHRDVWLSPNISVINGITIGENALVGIAANVTKKVEPNSVVAGNPAKILRTRF